MTCGLFWGEGWAWNRGNMGVSLAKLWGTCCGETLNKQEQWLQSNLDGRVLQPLAEMDKVLTFYPTPEGGSRNIPPSLYSSLVVETATCTM